MEIMSFLVLAGTLVGVVVLSAFVIRMSSSVATISKQLEDMQRSLLIEYPVRHGRQHRINHWSRHLHTFAEYGFFTVWEWRENEKKWHVSTLIPPGFDPGSPPSHPGAFDGDHVKTWNRGTKQ
jgi:hypothetical protein